MRRNAPFSRAERRAGRWTPRPDGTVTALHQDPVSVPFGRGAEPPAVRSVRRDCDQSPANFLTVCSSEPSRPHSLPERSYARAVIDALPGPRKPEAFLFPRHAEKHGSGSFDGFWRAVCADAGLGRLCLHDLRHTADTAASQTVMADENLPLVGKILGRRWPRTTGGYAHLADTHLVEAAERVGSIIAAAMVSAQTPPTNHGVA